MLARYHDPRGIVTIEFDRDAKNQIVVNYFSHWTGKSGTMVGQGTVGRSEWVRRVKRRGWKAEVPLTRAIKEEIACSELGEALAAGETPDWVV